MPTKAISKASEPTNLEKVYWPAEKYTKKDLLDYYEEITPFILPYLKDRPVMLKRFPNGIEGDGFFQKDTSTLNLPPEVQTVILRQENRDIQYILIQNLKTLLYVVNLGTIELHPFLTKGTNLESPLYFVIDLDPLNLPFEKVIEVALATHKLLAEIKVKHYCKTSGKRGLHICIPAQEKYTFEQIKQFGQLISLYIQSQLPKITSMERKPSQREKKVYLDVYQNNRGQTVVAPYSVRAIPSAPVSTPLAWEEVKKGLDPRDFNIKTVPERLKKTGDLFKPILKETLNLSDALKCLEKLL